MKASSSLRCCLMPMYMTMPAMLKQNSMASKNPSMFCNSSIQEEGIGHGVGFFMMGSPSTSRVIWP